jgi:hypothetical protein
MRLHRAICVLIGVGAAACNDPIAVTDDVGSGSGCTETSTMLPSVSEAGLAGDEVEALLAAVAQPLTAALTWHDGTRTQITSTLANLEVFKITSREDPGQRNDRTDDVHRCADRVSLKLDVSLSTTDGRLDEMFFGVMFESDESGTWTANPHESVEDVKGQYVRQVDDEGTLTGLHFALALGLDGFAGTVSEESRHGGRVNLSASLGTWPATQSD